MARNKRIKSPTETQNFLRLTRGAKETPDAAREQRWERADEREYAERREERAGKMDLAKYGFLTRVFGIGEQARINGAYLCICLFAILSYVFFEAGAPNLATAAFSLMSGCVGYLFGTR